MKYKIDIEDRSNDLFEHDADNVAEVRIFDNRGEDITKGSTVQMFLSKNALLGLGTELIRMAHDFHEGKHAHLEPVDEECQVQRMGVFLIPDSGNLMICCNEGKCIDEYL